jgi:hypothetical protein
MSGDHRAFGRETDRCPRQAGLFLAAFECVFGVPVRRAFGYHGDVVERLDDRRERTSAGELGNFDVGSGMVARWRGELEGGHRRPDAFDAQPTVPPGGVRTRNA